MKERLFKKAVKFANFSFVSTTTFAVQLFFTVFFTELFGIQYYISHAFALLIAWIMHFVYNMKLTFGIVDKLFVRFAKFTPLALLSSGLNWILVLACVEYLHLHYFISVILMSLMLAVFTFTTEEIWVFRKSAPVSVSGCEQEK